MTSLLHRPVRPDASTPDPAHRRPLALVAAAGGVVSALGPLVVCLAAGVMGWFLTDAGAHGTPSGGMRAGALGWLAAHGSGLHVAGALVSAVPLGLTAICAWTLWRVSLRVGDAVSGYGPDVERLADGERDLTVPVTAGLLALAYAVSAAVVGAVAATPTTAPSLTRTVLWSLVMAVVVGGAGVAVGSGRAAVWMAALPATARATLVTARSVLLTWLLVSGVTLLAALVVDLDTAVNILSQLHTDAGAAVLYLGLTLLALPNAVAFAGSYLLGPGFLVGTGTLVSPTAVSLGALPMFPLLAALPEGDATPVWTPWLMALGPLTAVVAVARTQRRLPVLRRESAALRGMGGGMLAALGFAVLAWLSGGAVGPGRMAQVGPVVGEVLLHALSSFGLAGLVTGLVMTWWQRRTLTAAEVEPDDPPETGPDDTAVRPRVR